MRKLLVIALMSVVASGVYAQTTSKKNCSEPEMVLVNYLDKAKIQENNLRPISKRLSPSEKKHLKEVLKYDVTEGRIWEDEQIVPNSHKGDDYEVFISCQDGVFYLTYIVTRKDEEVGRKDIQLDY